MPASKTLELERRVGKLERELAACQRQFEKGDAGAAVAARALDRQLNTIRKAIRAFFSAAEVMGIDWECDPGLARAADELAKLSLTPNATTPPRTKRTPR